MSKKSIINTLVPKLRGKTVAISGGTGGIGRELCLLLAEAGANLVLLDRNRKKSDTLKKELESADCGISVRQIRLDLEDTDSVKDACDELSRLPIDALVLCAGAYHIPRKTCASGHDNIFQINFISPYCLCRALKPKIEERGGRIVAVSSLSYSFARFNESNLEYIGKHAAAAYGNAKRFLTFSLYRLFDGSDVLSIAHPGISPTGITAGYGKFVSALIKYPMKLIFMSPRRACLSVLHGLVEPCREGEWLGPRLFGIWGRPKKSRICGYSRNEADKMFNLAESEAENGVFC